MANIRKVDRMIKKLNVIYKRGYLPKREAENYSLLYTRSVNCFGHACFNLSNNYLSKLDRYMQELESFFRDFGSSGIGSYFKVAQEKIKKIGLTIQESSLSEKIEKNQWKIAYYVMDDEFYGRDVHFMIQTKSGKWTCKRGRYSVVEVYDKLPENYHEDYSLVGIYKITNPYVEVANKNAKEDELEM